MAKYALAIGINRYGHGADLSGCVNDANDWATTLHDRGFGVTTLLDDRATGAAIRQGIDDALSMAGRGDTVVVTFSGHGTWIPDTDGDETDRRDEALCPVDLWDNGVITDDDLYDMFSRKDPRARAVLISDSCHSGTVSRLAGPLRRDGEFRRPRFLEPSRFLDERTAQRARSIPRPVATTAPRHPNLLMSGCSDPEYSYDATFNGRANGAFTFVALAALQNAGTDATYRTWFAGIRSRLPSVDFPDQTPQLYGTSTQKAWRALA
jgi:metacaspase-1